MLQDHHPTIMYASQRKIVSTDYRNVRHLTGFLSRFQLCGVGMQWVNLILYIVPNVNVLVNRCDGRSRLVGKETALL